MSESQRPAAGAPQQSFAALRHRGYRAYFVLSATAMMADSIEHVISYWILFQKFHSPALAGFAILAHWLPALFFSVYSGALADRFDPRRIIQIAMLLFMAASIGWGVLFMTDTLQQWHAMVLLVIHGLASVLWHPSGQLLIHDIVGAAHLQSAVRLTATSRYLGLLCGPAVGGGLLLLLGPAWGILLNALFYLPAILWLWKAPYGPAYRGVKPPPRAVRGLADILATLRAVAGNRTIVSMTLLSASAAFFVGNGYQSQMPEFAHDLGHVDADLSYSMLLAADAAGALAAGIALESRGLLRASPRGALVLAILWCLSIAGFAAAGHYWIALPLLFLTGFFELSFNTMAQTLVQLEAPSAIRGRVIGLYQVGALGMRSFSGVTIGVAGSLIGIHWSLALSAIAMLTVASALLAFSMRARAGR